jgi:hypothetical protein
MIAKGFAPSARRDDEEACIFSRRCEKCGLAAWQLQIHRRDGYAS